MSYWTTVSGFIHITFKDIKSVHPELTLKDIFGKTCHAFSPREEWKACTVPKGDEGSIQYTCTNTYRHSPYNNEREWIVSLWGDLRGWEKGPKDIIQWVEKIVQDERIWINTFYIEIQDQDADYPFILTCKDILPDLDRVIYIKVGG